MLAKVVLPVTIGFAAAVAATAFLVSRRGEDTFASPPTESLAHRSESDLSPITGPEHKTEETHLAVPFPADRLLEQRQTLPDSAPKETPLNGLLVDEQTGEPVPDYQIRVRDETGELITTDGTGRFRSSKEYLPSRIPLKLIDVPGQASPLSALKKTKRATAVDHNADGSETIEARVEIPVGPTYRLALELPPRLRIEDLVAELGMVQTTTAQVLIWESPVRPGKQAWVRFAPIPDGVLPGPPWSLTIRSKDGLDSATAEVSAIKGVYPETVHMVFVRDSSLTGTVFEEDGSPASGKVLYLFRDDGAIFERTPRSSRTNELGSYSFLGLAPGPYGLTIALDAPSTEASFRKLFHYVHLLPGETVRQDVHLSGPPSAGRISGVLRSESGTYKTPIDLTMTAPRYIADGTVITLQARATWEDRNGNLEAPFTFENVPEGEFSLAIWPPANEWWAPRSIKVHAPQDDLEFLHRDLTETRQIGFQPIDATTGKDVDQYWFFIEFRDKREEVREGGPIRSGRPCTSVPVKDVPFDWVVGAPGYIPQRGDESLFSKEEGSASEVVRSLELQPGWGMELEIRGTTTDDRFPLEGVHVYVDGDLAGTSNGQGLVLLKSPQEPTEIRVELDGWAYEVGILDADTGRPRRFALRGTIGLRRSE